MPPSDEQAAQSESSTRILVIEDDRDIRNVMVLALQDESYEVDEAPSGRAALDLLAGATTHPQVILLDMKMPGMDGGQFVRRYRELYGDRSRIIIVTASNNQSQHDEIGVDGYLSKPFDIGALIDTVSALAR